MVGLGGTRDKDGGSKTPAPLVTAPLAAGSWRTCRQKQQLAKARAGDVGTCPEGEKLHSDSGVFLDTHSLQEPHQPGKGEHPPPAARLSPSAVGVGLGNTMGGLEVRVRLFPGSIWMGLGCC